MGRGLAELAWAYGLYEGEGSCGKDPRGYPKIEIKMTDLDVLERFQRVLGCGSISKVSMKDRPAHYKQQYAYRTSGWHNVTKFRDGGLEWLSARRLRQLDAVLVDAPPERPTSPPCGLASEPGYARHKRRKEPSCAPCREAHAHYEQQRTGVKPRYPDGSGYRTRIKEPDAL